MGRVNRNVPISWSPVLCSGKNIAAAVSNHFIMKGTLSVSVAGRAPR
jgi:hypothetical protein